MTLEKYTNFNSYGDGMEHLICLDGAWATILVKEDCKLSTVTLGFEDKDYVRRLAKDLTALAKQFDEMTTVSEDVSDE